MQYPRRTHLSPGGYSDDAPITAPICYQVLRTLRFCCQVSSLDPYGGPGRAATSVVGSRVMHGGRSTASYNDWRAERERLTGRQESVSLSGRRLEVTWENGVAHSGSFRFADTEEVTGSNPVAPTTPLLNRASVDSVVRRVARRPMVGRPSGRRALPYLTKAFTPAGSRTCERTSSPPAPGSDIQRPRRRLVGTRGPQFGAVAWLRRSVSLSRSRRGAGS